MIPELLLLLKSLPAWLGHAVEILIVAVIFSFAVIFLWGFALGIRIVRGKRKEIKKISILPPSIEFYSDEDKPSDPT